MIKLFLVLLSLFQRNKTSLLAALVTLSLLPLTLYSRNIGLCGGDLFHERQKIINRLVLKIKNAREDKRYPHKKKLIEDFGYIGIENIIRYDEDTLNGVFLVLLEHMDFYVRYKALYALRRNKQHIKKNMPFILPFLDSDNLYLKDMAISSLTEAGNSSILPALEKALKKETNEYVINSLQYAINRIKRNSKQIFPDFNHGLKKERLTEYWHYKMGEGIENYKERVSRIYFKKVLLTNFPRALSFSQVIS